MDANSKTNFTKLIRKPSIERELALHRGSPALDSGAGSSRSDSPRLTELHPPGNRYSPSFSEPPPPPPPRNTPPLLHLMFLISLYLTTCNNSLNVCLLLLLYQQELHLLCPFTISPLFSREGLVRLAVFHLHLVVNLWLCRTDLR